MMNFLFVSVSRCACMLAVTLFCNLALTAELEGTATVAAPAENVTVEKAAYDETVIPLKINDEKAQVGEKQNSTAKMTLGFILVAVLLTGGIFYVRRYSGSKESQSSLMQIKVVAQHYLGPKKSVAVIRVAGESMLVGITDNQINLIKSLAVLDEDMVQTNAPTTFAKVNAAIAAESDNDQMNTAVEEEFSFADLKSTVADKLKSVRGFQ